MQPLFVYGTLQMPAVQLRLYGRTISGQPDTLHGFRRAMILLDGLYPIAVPDPHSSISGAVLLLTAAELQTTDAYEGPAYQRSPVLLASGSEAWVYRDNPASAFHRLIR